MDPPSVMILGCGRSGTSIFGELFECFPDYIYRSEPPFADVMDADFAKPRAFKVPRESEGYKPSPGLSFPLKTLLRKQPNMQMFWIVRHPLDAICSLRVGIANDWGHHPKPPDWREWLGRPLIERCAHHWEYINSFGYAEVAEVAILVRFEDMVLRSSEFALQICDTLGQQTEYLDQASANWARRVQNTNNDDFIEARTSRFYSRPDHSVRVERWRENLSRREIDSVFPILCRTAKSFGYELTKC